MTTPQWRVDELEALEERLDDEIAGLDEQLSTVYSQIEKLTFGIDGYLAENDFMQVEQAVNELVGLLGEDVEDDLELLIKLAEIKNGEGDSVSCGAEIPTLSEDQLPKRDPARSDDPYGFDNEVLALRERVDACADHLRDLFDQASEHWQEARQAANNGSGAAARTELRYARKAAAQAEKAFALWQACLSELYVASPGSLGPISDLLIAPVERWITSAE
ncbi:hypothetical protein AB0K60_29685 [Thermopolyspora sp. NPDC052614]|uniref:hypothetical protein n=1 Tax=Thermopolyspora sp. NPDC052614 TaxID=3155682 RepID=UPI003431D945